MAKDFAKQFYGSKAWLKCRAAYIESVNGLCERCLDKDRYTPGYIVHHKQPITPDNINDPNITLDHSNLEYLCIECHNITHYGTGLVRDDIYFNDKGELVERVTHTHKDSNHMNIVIVWGCPGSGKTTYVRKHMSEGDMVVDLDLISECISMQPKSQCPSNLVGTALKIRQFIYSLITNRDIKCNSIWIVAGLPMKYERDMLVTDLRATDMVYIEATQEECIERTLKDTERVDKDLQKQIIQTWFRKYNRDSLPPV